MEHGPHQESGVSLDRACLARENTGEAAAAPGALRKNAGLKPLTISSPGNVAQTATCREALKGGEPFPRHLQRFAVAASFRT